MSQRASRARRGRSRQEAAALPATAGFSPGPIIFVAALAIATVLAFTPVLNNGFVNWDDPFTLQNNPHLTFPGILVWAFTTLEMGHYQPLAWLSWAATKGLFGLRPSAFHALSLLGHVANGCLMYCTALALAGRASVDRRVARTSAIVAALIFSIHPMRVEVVAWASAFPYILGLGFVLMSLLAYMAYTKQRRVLWLTVSFAAFALSLASRANALTFPLVLLVLDAYPLGRVTGGPSATPWKQLLLEKLPFAVVAAVAAIVEAGARDLPTLSDVSVAERLTIAATAPFRYLAHTVFPYRLTPVDALPLAPHTDAWLLASAAGAFVLVSLAAWTTRRRWPATAAGWFAYVLLLGPVAGLTPSGQQAAADRYTYLPGVVVALVIGAGIARAAVLLKRRWIAFAIAAAWLATLGASTWYQVGWWRDSITLWTRAVDLDSTNDLASYNLAVALAEAGRADDAIARYDQTLQLVPDQRLARENRDHLLVQRSVHDGDRFLESGRFQDAIAAYSRALAIDPGLTRARSGRGIALARSGRLQNAIGDLEGAFDETADPGVADALAFALADSGRFREAVDVLGRALAKHGDNAELAGNLARLFATAPDPTVRDPAQSLRLALAVRDHTGGEDPRVLDTLAAAYAATGQRELARHTVDEAVTLARQQGNVSLADEIALHGRAYGH